MRPARLLVAINSLEGGGAERVVSVLLGEFAGGLAAEFGFAPELALLDDLPPRYAVPASVPVHVIGAQGAMWRSVVGFDRLVGRIRPDVCLSFLSRANFAAVLACRRRGAPCLISERVNTSSHFSGAGLRERLSKLLIRGLYPRADRILAVSEGVAADLARNYGAPPEKLVVIHNPYDLDAIARAAREAPPPGFAPDEPYLVAVGRLTRNKNFAMLIEAYAASGIPEALVVLGEGEERPALEALIRARGLENRVRLPGFCANPYPIVSRARGFVQSSNAEGFPNAAAEAMALARPVALTDCPSGPGELLSGAATGSGVTRTPFGLLTRPGDAEALCEAIRMLAAPGAQAELGTAARRRMEDFRADAIARRYASEIAAAISPAHARPIFARRTP